MLELTNEFTDNQALHLENDNSKELVVKLEATIPNRIEITQSYEGFVKTVQKSLKSEMKELRSFVKQSTQLTRLEINSLKQSINEIKEMMDELLGKKRKI